MTGDRAHPLDAELAVVVAQLTTLDLSDIPAARAEQARLRALQPAPDRRGVEVSDAVAPGRGGEPDVAVRIYRPTGATGGVGVLDIHGGGFVLGGFDTSAAACLELSRELGAVVVSVDYRLSPEHTYPAALRDCRAALQWFADEAATLGVDPDRIAVHGISAGAGLGAGLALHIRDHGGPPIAFLYLAIPELDDRQATPSMLAFTDTPVWTQAKARISWDAYLGPGRAGTADVEPYAAPSRADGLTGLTGLPATYLSVATFDPLRDEAIVFGQALVAAGVPVELHLFPGTFHGSSLIDSAVSRREGRERIEVLRQALQANPEREPSVTNSTDLERRIRLIEDRIAIRELTARYNRAVDEGRADDLAACFTVDCRYWIDRDGRLTAGRDHIANMSRVIGFGTVHFTVDASVEVTGDTATQVCHNLCAVRTRDRTPGSSRWNVTGRYYDTLVRHPDEGWLFSERLWVPDALVEGLPDW